MLIRLATVQDAEVLAAVQVRTWQAYRGQIPQEYLDQRDPVRRRQAWLEWFGGNPAPAAVFVAEHEADGVVGFITVAPSRDGDTDPRLVGEVQAVYVLPEYWGRGAGRLLMEAALRRLHESGYEEVVLWVLATNERARRFYEAAGWQADGSTKTDASRGFPLVEIRYRTSTLDRPGSG